MAGKITPEAALHAKEIIEHNFTDSFISERRFLKEKLADGGWIDVSYLLQINKLTAITTDLNLLKKIIKSIDSLELNGDQMRRKTPVKHKKNGDRTTLIVAPITSEHTVEKLHEIFSTYGEVAFIQIPRDSEHKPKGFAKVEYQNRKVADSALKAILASDLSSTFNVSLLLALELQRREDYRKYKNKPNMIAYKAGAGVGMITDSQIIEALKEAYPRIKDVKVEAKEGYGFIQFTDLSYAREVVVRGLKIDEKPLKLENLRMLIKGKKPGEREIMKRLRAQRLSREKEKAEKQQNQQPKEKKAKGSKRKGSGDSDVEMAEQPVKKVKSATAPVTLASTAQPAPVKTEKKGKKAARREIKAKKSEMQEANK
eukprot:TRINITY_DN2314_c0_g1_i2.p1 TRINITY_DN2314_c0_g1~~TRINITY_DN2314_c0_g1_i2.p1  ORF type:complete len:370 (-),score=67.32 TRINITY_DN2314_c0_g1_i2:46-1155(-)